jgi:CheY-like chemotaxis protein
MSPTAGLPQPLVLVVDDNSEVRAMIAALLAEQGVRPIEAATEAEAMQHVTSRRFDAVVLDLAMTGAGVLLIARFRGLGNGRDLPVVAMNSLPPGPEREAARLLAAQFACVEFVDKPVTGRRLAAALVGLLATA